MCIGFDKVDGSIRVYDGNRYLILFNPEKYSASYNRIRFLISQESDITYIYSHNYARIKTDSCDSLPLDKTLTLHVIIIIRCVFNMNQNYYYFNIFLGKMFVSIIWK